MSFRVFTHLFRVSLAFRIFYASQRLHIEVNTSRGYHNINTFGTGVYVSCVSPMLSFGSSVSGIPNTCYPPWPLLLGISVYHRLAKEFTLIPQ
jgi:hypothetical protein